MNASPLTKPWGLTPDQVFKQINSSIEGLTALEVKSRLKSFGLNIIKPRKNLNILTLFLSQFKSPITLILIFAAVLSLFLGDDVIDSIIIFAIILISSLLGFWQEYSANSSVQKLIGLVKVTTTVIRDGKPQSILAEDIVLGDVITFSAGSSIPADCYLLESKDLFIDESALTGEAYPAEKSPGQLNSNLGLHERTNMLYMGTHVVSGDGKGVVIATGLNTEFGHIAQTLNTQAPETEFERGVRRFGYLLMEVTLLLIVTIFAINVYLHRPVLDSFIFSLALAVGLTPQLLPAIISINLARGARKMAAEKVVVKKLASIENFGSMDVLCADKTGTLTTGVMTIHNAVDGFGENSQKVSLYSYLNASFETGFLNPIDQAIRSQKNINISEYKKLDEVPYDFLRKRLSILVAEGKTNTMITKGAVLELMKICKYAEKPNGEVVEIDQARSEIERQYQDFSKQGFRTIAVAYREMGSKSVIDKSHEEDMTFLGLITLADPLKADIIQTVNDLKQLGVNLKIITGDNHLIAQYIGQELHLNDFTIFTSEQLQAMSDSALVEQVNKIDIFAEVDPNEKQRIILALEKAGNVVGYIGDGINDASALHTADVGISVAGGVDVAKDSADIVLLEKDLAVLRDGIKNGRVTFANTLKYVFMATSANFGNMFSMAGASLFLPFLPLLPKQILLTNLLTDFPEMTIATDQVDLELINKPKRWDVKFIRDFMIVFGILSSVFDYLTFAAIYFVVKSNPIIFRSGWFIESVASAALVVLVIRTRRSFFQSMPSKYLLWTTLSVVVAAFILPFTPLGTIFGFQPIPVTLLVFIVLIIGLYMLLAEMAKRFFYARVNF